MAIAPFNFLFNEAGRIGRVAFSLGFTFVSLFGAGMFEVADFISNKNAQGVFVIFTFTCCLLSLRALAEKRLHDIGKTIWSSLWRNQIPIIGGLWAIYEVFFKPGHAGSNKFGEAPKS